MALICLGCAPAIRGSDDGDPPVPAPTAAPTSTPADPLSWAYVVDNDFNQVYQYSVNSSTGAFEAATPTTVATGNGPYAAAVSPDGKWAYVANYLSKTVSQYSIDQTTGALTALNPTSITTGATAERPVSIAVSPNGSWLYVGKNGSDTIAQYTIAQDTGKLTAMSPATVLGDAGPSAPVDVAVSSNNSWLYYTTGSSSTISHYTIAQDTGKVTAAAAAAVAYYPIEVALSPNAQWAYVLRENSALISQFTIAQATGNLTAMNPATVTAGGSLDRVIVSSNGLWLYASSTAGQIYQFSIAQDTGKLTVMSPASIGFQWGGSSLAFSSNGLWLYAIGYQQIYQFSIHQSTGALSVHDAASNDAISLPLNLVIH